MRFKITGSGSYVPKLTKVNDDFLDSEFFDKNGSSFENSKEDPVPVNKIFRLARPGSAQTSQETIATIVSLKTSKNL